MKTMRVYGRTNIRMNGAIIMMKAKMMTQSLLIQHHEKYHDVRMWYIGNTGLDTAKIMKHFFQTN